MIERFRYHASAVGVAGHILRPFDEVLPIQASLDLPTTGGFGETRVGRFRFREVVSFDTASALVAGSRSSKHGSFASLATVTVEGVNILNMVTADRVVARIASSHPDDADNQPCIRPIGSYFENLRIAGYPITLDLAVDTFTKFDTADIVRDAYRDNRDNFRDLFNELSLIGREEEIPADLRKHFPWRRAEKSEKIPEHRGNILCSLVRGVVGTVPGERHGHVIWIPGFGTIRLAEFRISDTRRRITMLQVTLGCTPEGDVAVAQAAGEGDVDGN
jgi:hypothetical protein